MRKDTARVKGKKWLGWWICKHCSFWHARWEGDPTACPLCGIYLMHPAEPNPENEEGEVFPSLHPKTDRPPT